MPIKKALVKNEFNKQEAFVPTSMPLAKPFLKWAGGKSQLIKSFQQLYPQQLVHHTIKNYYEPFLGSGAVFFDIAQKFHIENAYLYDINEALILTYKVIQRDVSILTDFLYQHQQAYSTLDKKKRAAYFYEQRSKYNLNSEAVDYKQYSESWIPRAAQLIFLNKTCFNGLYRVNAKGDFNTPAGDYVNPTICDEYNLLAAARVLKIATIKRAGFMQVKKDLKRNSFVYFDPPYRPLTKTASFTAYSKHAFGDNEQKELSTLFNFIHNKDGLVMLSNSDPKNNDPKDDFFDELYKDFTIVRVPAKRMINADASKRGSINEIVVTNY